MKLKKLKHNSYISCAPVWRMTGSVVFTESVLSTNERKRTA